MSYNLAYRFHSWRMTFYHLRAGTRFYIVYRSHLCISHIICEVKSTQCTSICHHSASSRLDTSNSCCSPYNLHIRSSYPHILSIFFPVGSGHIRSHTQHRCHSSSLWGSPQSWWDSSCTDPGCWGPFRPHSPRMCGSLSKICSEPTGLCTWRRSFHRRRAQKGSYRPHTSRMTTWRRNLYGSCWCTLHRPYCPLLGLYHCSIGRTTHRRTVLGMRKCHFYSHSMNSGSTPSEHNFPRRQRTCNLQALHTCILSWGNLEQLHGT